VPTLRNVDKRPYPEFVKAYGHNGYFKSLKAIVHFYNTRDVLPRCGPNDPGEMTRCWPAPESTDNMNASKVGHLGLTDDEENALVSFMQTLSDGFMPPRCFCIKAFFESDITEIDAAVVPHGHVVGPCVPGGCL
jgi:cytochrome c peroxidase